MAVFTKSITIDFENPRQETLRQWLASLPSECRKLPPLTITVRVTGEIEEFDDDEISERYNEIFDTETPWAERLYRHIAMGETDEALELLHRECNEDLPPPFPRKKDRRHAVAAGGSCPC